MCVSCNGYIENVSEYEGEFCGHRKKQWYDEQLIMSPLAEDCAQHFTYTAQGLIRAKYGNEKAKAMIKNLGLDEYALNEARQKALEAIGYKWIQERGRYPC